ncbi:MAG: RimJ/RimL family protein N-acetyltransferase [Porticoccaceae bacterium]|jgi:RimJ/RimL family protein N-acetyltransferase
MFGWRSDAETSYFLSGTAPKSIENQQAWFERVCRDTSCSCHIIEDQGVPIGCTSIFKADSAHSEAEWGIVMGKHREQGVMRAIAPLCCICAFEFGELENLYTCINEDNGGAIRRVEQTGATLFEEPSVYRKEGELLFRLNADEFKKMLVTLVDASPALKEALDVEMHLIETVE